MYTSQITAVALVAVASFFQACPAPFIGPILDMVTGGGSKRSDVTDNLDKCIQDGRAQTEHVQFIGETDVIFNGVPVSCMEEVKTWNSHPQSRLLEKDYGTVTVLNDTAIKIVGLPEKTVDLIQSAMSKPQ